MPVLPVVAGPKATVGALDGLLGNIVWDQRTNYESRGPLLHMAQETARHLAHLSPPPRWEAVRTAQAFLHSNVVSAHSSAPAFQAQAPSRPVVMVVLESFWDPSALRNAGLSRDPLDERFRALWEAAGHSQALVPVFGGYTANSEFEALCGFPIAEDTVFFETRLHNKVPCLPHLLSEAGYAATVDMIFDYLAEKFLIHWQSIMIFLSRVAILINEL
ncbi:MAG: hypothetical protein EOM66_11245 [Clostridia bacterium]|nr:hypothetical protein [Clostridia bacterium]